MNSKNSLPVAILAVTAIVGCAESPGTQLAEKLLKDFSAKATAVIQSPSKDPSERIAAFERDLTVNDEIIDMPDLGVDRKRFDDNEVRRIRETCVCSSVAPGQDSGSSHSYREYCACEEVASFPGYSSTQDPVRTDEYEISYVLERIWEDSQAEEITLKSHGDEITVILNREAEECLIEDNENLTEENAEMGSYRECAKLVRRTRRAIASTRDNLQRRGYIARYNRNR